MLLGNLLKSVKGKYQKIPIKGICFDSRKIKKKIFFLQLKVIKYQEIILLMRLFTKGPQPLLQVKI